MSRNSRRRLTARRRIAARRATPATTHAQAPSAPDSDRSATFSFRLLAGCALLFGLALIQDPGFLASDTKFDLVVDPAGFLGRSLHLWDGRAAFGQLQNQAYGYLWPMGPFFALGWLASIPAWVLQRLWWGLIMSAAFAGTAKVARALGVRSDLACLVAGVAFALSPRMLTTMGPISIEAWPSALAPWVLLPLIRGATAGSPRRAAALSALAVTMVGGVNAAATFAVLPMGALWLLTRTPGPRRKSLMLWWPAFTALGTLWWLVPLFLMGAYSPPFLDYIETSSVTTFPTTAFDTLRGTSNWVPYVDAGSRAGNDLLRTSYLALNSGVVLLLGFAGLMDRGNPHRRFLALTLLLGVVMVTAGHEGNIQGWFSGGLREMLDGSLSPLRNVHKFDPIIRLPMVLGLAFVVDRAVRESAVRLSRSGARSGGSGPVLVRLNQLTFVAMVVVVVAGAALPALAGRIAPAGATLGVPGYWQETADWLEAESSDGTALLVPGASFAEYVWGSPKDEPLQFLARSRWATRNVIPLTPPGNIRMLDGIEGRLAQGRGSAGLTAALRRAGVRFLVVRNDLERDDDVPEAVQVHQAIDQSPGLTRVATFGPDTGGEGHLLDDSGRLVVNGGWQATYPSVEIFEVAGVVAPAMSSKVPPVLAAGPEDLPDLLDLGVVGEGPVVLAADTVHAPEGPVVLTDGLRARERFFARIHDGASAAITPGDERRSGNPSRDYLIDTDDRWSTTVRLEGARAISASSSMSDSNTLGGSRRGELPYAAVDGSGATSWISGAGKSGRVWWQVTFDEPFSPASVTLTGGPQALDNQVIRVRTETSVTDTVALGPGDRREVELPVGEATGWLRVEEASVATGSTMSLAEVEVGDLVVTRSLVLPELPADWAAPDTIVLRADLDARRGCVVIALDTRCVQGRDRASEEPVGMRRVVTLNQAGTYTPSLIVSPLAGAALDELVLRNQPVRVSASTVAVPDPRASPVAAIDGDPGTTWTAEVDDFKPSLALSWLGRRAVSGVQLSVDRDTAARRPTRIILTSPDGSRDVALDETGQASFPPLRTDQMTIQIVESEDASSLGFDAQTSALGVGIGELRLTGVSYLPLVLPADPVAYPCGSGPDVVVAGSSRRTSVVSSPADLGRGLAARAELCGAQTVALVAGENDIVANSSSSFEVASLVLAASAGVGDTPTDAGIDPSGPVTRTMRPEPGDAVVSMRENANAGWRATQDGQALEPVVIDGWQQGWLLRDSDEPVAAYFAPDRTYRLGLAGGLLCVVVLLVVTLLTRRRWAGPLLPPLEGRELSRPVLLGIGVVGTGVVAGWIGVLVGVLTLATALALDRRAPELAPWVLAAPSLAAATAYAVRPWGSVSGWAGSDSWPSYLMLVPLVGVLALAGAGVRRRPRPLKRAIGRSTRR